MKDLPLLIQNLSTSTEILKQFVGSIPDERLYLQRRPGFWTIAEHVQHLADVQPMLLERIQRFESETEPHFIPFIPDEQQRQPGIKPIDISQALEDFARSRRQQTDLLSRIDASAFEKTATHPEYTHYGLYILARHILMHDHWHMYRMEELWLARDEYVTEAG